jgi:hypothetical protein
MRLIHAEGFALFEKHFILEEVVKFILIGGCILGLR